ncbi:MAG: helicase, partial [Syntrophales bacterium LBB04]|nr:helicase [Syntrophales bacterium LBB04]
MTPKTNDFFSAEPILESLKRFQRRTAEYVFRRLYLDDDQTRRFLIADEVGLGKTFVAKGVIAKATEHLRKKHGPNHRIDIIYLCSNASIASQNLSRLTFGENNHKLASRLTLLS